MSCVVIANIGCWCHYQSFQGKGNLVGWQDEIYASSVNGEAGHTRTHASCFRLGEYHAAHLSNGLHPTRAIAASAGEKHADRSPFKTSRH